MRMFFKSKHINTAGVIDFEPIIAENPVYYQTGLIMINLKFHNPTQYNAKINGFTIPPNGNLSFDFTSEFYTSQFGGYGFRPQSLPDFVLGFPNKSGGVDISVLYGNPNL